MMHSHEGDHNAAEAEEDLGGGAPKPPKWEDITDLLRDACKGMALGQMIHKQVCIITTTAAKRAVAASESTGLASPFPSPSP